MITVLELMFHTSQLAGCAVSALSSPTPISLNNPKMGVQ